MSPTERGIDYSIPGYTRSQKRMFNCSIKYISVENTEKFAIRERTSEALKNLIMSELWQEIENRRRNTSSTILDFISSREIYYAWLLETNEKEFLRICNHQKQKQKEKQKEARRKTFRKKVE